MLLPQTAELRKTMNLKTMMQLGKHSVEVFCWGLLGISLWEEQAEYIKNSNAMFNVLSAGRRWGKTTGAAVKALFNGFYRRRPRYAGNGQGLVLKDYRILVGSRTQAQANKILDEARKMVQDKDSLLQKFYVKVDKSQNFPILILKSANGQTFEIHSRSFRDVDNLQGFNYDLVIVDEAVRIPRLGTDVFTTIMPFIGDTAGTIDFISSPSLMLGDFYSFHQRGVEGSRKYNPEWKSFFGDSRNNPNNDPTTFSKFANQYPTQQIANIFLGGQFPQVGLGLFSVNDVVEMFTKDSFDNGMVFEGDLQPFVYDDWTGDPSNVVHCADIAKKKDWTVIFSIDTTGSRNRVIGFQRFNGQDYPVISEKILSQRAKFGGGRVAIDSTGVGEAVADQLDVTLGEGYVERVYIGSNKQDMLVNLQKHVQTHSLEMPDIPCLEEEMIAYMLPDNNLITDCVMALAVGCWVIEHGPEITRKKGKIGSTLTDAAVEVMSGLKVKKKERRYV